MRYDKTERLGVIETNRIVTKELDWIFREQSIIDVGLDAIIEEVREGNPTGKFLAVQIKSGQSNFFVSDKIITYYVSNIHYNYWLNLNIPIVLIAYFPETNKTYWYEIIENNLKRTKKKWKLEIPRKQEFNIKAKNRLTEILAEKATKSFAFEISKGEFEPDSIYDIIEDINCIADSNVNVNKIIRVIYEFIDKNNIFNQELGQFLEEGLSDRDLRVKASIKGFARLIDVTARRIENEMQIFSKLYSVGFYAFEKVILLHYLFTSDNENLTNAKKSIEDLPSSIDVALDGTNKLRNSVSRLPNRIAILKQAKINFLDVLDMVLNEWSEAKVIAEKIIENLEIKK